MRPMLIAVAAVASAAFVAMPPANAFPFKMDTNSIAYWLNTLRFSMDPTFNNRIHSLYNCGVAYKSDSGHGLFSCLGYIDISDGTYPNGTRCEITVNMAFDSQTAINEKVWIDLKNKYCYKGVAQLSWQ